MTASPKSLLAREIKQGRPFACIQQEVYLSLVRTASALSHAMDQCFREFGITQPQYNVLRILQGAGEDGLGRNEIGERMVHTMPDMSRMLARMEKLGWIARERGQEDRRHVPTRLTAAGKRLLGRIDQPLADLHRTQFAGIDEAGLKKLLALLHAARTA